MSVLFASDLDHLFADCSGCIPTLFETVLTTLLSFHRTTTIPFLVSVLSSASPSLSQIGVEHRQAGLSEGYLCEQFPLM